MAMAWDSTAAVSQAMPDTSSWSFSASDVRGVRLELSALLEANPEVRLSHLFELMDTDHDVSSITLEA